MTVKDLMASSVCFVKPDAPLHQAAALMKRYDIGFVPVCDNRGALLGAVTDRDLITRADWEGPLAAQAPVSDLMTRELVTVPPDMDIHRAACIFSERKVRRLPVVENGSMMQSIRAVTACAAAATMAGYRWIAARPLSGKSSRAPVRVRITVSTVRRIRRLLL